MLKISTLKFDMGLIKREDNSCQRRLTMENAKTVFINMLKTGVCAMALTGILLSPPSVYAADNNAPIKKANTEVEQNTQDKTAEKRKQIASEAITALNETRAALAFLDKGKKAEALSSLEKATGKLELILARDPGLALAPTGVSAVTYDIYASTDAIKAATSKAEGLLESGKVQEARTILKNLASETVIAVTNIPLATYPAAIKEAVRLIDAAKTAEAKAVLQTAINTLVVKETIVPLPVVTAEFLLKEAETLADKKDRTEDDNKNLTNLLNQSRTNIEMAQVLGYGTKDDFDVFYKELSLIEEKTSGGKSGLSLFDKIKTSMTVMFEDSQHDTQKLKAN
jgi:hypothetical protein